MTVMLAKQRRRIRFRCNRLGPVAQSAWPAWPAVRAGPSVAPGAAAPPPHPGRSRPAFAVRPNYTHLFAGTYDTSLPP